jgi:hypothetical protein
MNVRRPLLTFALFTYNQQEYVDFALQAAFRQSYGPLQIIISDDCSDDATYEQILRTVDGYRGPHEVGVRRNERRLGIGGHVNQVMATVETPLIVAAAGDDVSAPHRVEAIYDAWARSDGRAHLFCSAAVEMSPEGQLLRARSGYPSMEFDPLRVALRGFSILGSTAAWTRWLWDRFGPLPDGTNHEDQVMTLWGAACGGIRALQEPLVLYRVGVSRWLIEHAATPDDRRARAMRAALQLALAESQRRSNLAAENPAIADALDRRIRAMHAVAEIRQWRLPSPRDVARLAADPSWAPAVLRAAIRTWIPGVDRVVSLTRQARLRGDRDAAEIERLLSRQPWLGQPVGSQS